MQSTVQEHNTQSKTKTGAKPFVPSVPVVQKKLKIGSPDDPMEAEADAIADRVVSQKEMAPPPTPNKGALVQKKCSNCKDEELQKKPLADSITPLVQKRSLSQGTDSVVSDGVSNKIESTRGSGSTMEDGTKGYMENRFGNDFSNVRIHTDSNAVQLSKSLNAQAFTVGNDIYFNEGKYNPSTTSGKHLLAHELTHTIQQNGGEYHTAQAKLIQRTEEEDAANAARAAYAEMVREAIAQINDQDLAATTFGNMLGPFFEQLAQDSAIVWRSADGTEITGTGANFQLPGGSGRIHHRLIIAEGMEEDVNGLYHDGNRTITLNRENLTTVDGIRSTLYHEGVHMLGDILTNRGADALGGLSDPSVRALHDQLNSSRKPQLRRWVEFIRNSVNTRRTSQGTAEIPESEIDRIIDFLWDEMVTRAETFYFELQYQLNQDRSLPDGLPNRKLFTLESLKRYLVLGNFLTQDDIDNLSDDDVLLLDSLQRRLLNEQIYFSRAVRHIPNVHNPHPGLPPDPTTIIIERSEFQDREPLLRLEPPDLLGEIVEDARELAEED